jgi:hypothetical protein
MLIYYSLLEDKYIRQFLLVFVTFASVASLVTEQNGKIYDVVFIHLECLHQL